MANKVAMPIIQKEVTFYEDMIVAVRLDDGEIYVPIRPICDNLGVALAGQRERINRDPVLFEVATSVSVTLTQQARKMICLPLKYIPGWLFGINVNRVKPELRERIMRYQRECYDVLAEAFVEGRLTDDGVEALIQADPDNVAVQAYQMAMAIARLARQQLAIEVHLQNQTEILGDHELRLEHLEASLSMDATVSDEQAAQLSQAVKALALVLGQQTKRNEFPGVYGELYRRYNCSSYKLLKRKDFEPAMAWLNEWKASLESDGF